ncbi:MAG: hypothetical protein K5787_13590 [Lentisphaeria bacterium]|nr:hypothetical protein [Lentisphaeria bacterium]
MARQSDAEKNNSTQMNATAAEAVVKEDGGVRIVFIGNSITLHGAAPHIGWNHVWGMAASALEKDYVHIVTRGIEVETGRKADVRVRNLADFERNFNTYDYSRDQDLVDFNPDYLVIALGENVADLPTQEERLAFRKAFKTLLGKFMRGRAKPNTVVRGVFWPNAWKDEMMAHAASDFALPFVKADIAKDESMMALGLFEHTGVQYHPGDKGMAEIASRILEGFFPKKSGYDVKVDGKSVFVRPILVSAMPFNQWAPGYQRPMDQTEVAGMVKIEAEGATEFVVKSSRAFKVAKVRPLRAGVKTVVDRGEIRFTLPKPGYYVLELDGYHNPLEIFVDEKRDFAKEREEANIVFGPGIHEPVVVKLKSHDRVFLDKDAFVLGSFQVDGAEDVKISGYGIICGSRNRRVGDHCYREGMDFAVRVMDSKHIVFDGPTILDSSCWCVTSFNSSDVEFAHLKITAAWRYNTDGIDICNSQHVSIHDCFVHSFDDTIVLKGNFPEFDRKDPVDDVKVERCVCWCGWGRTLEIGLETWAPYYRGIVFEDCDLIHNNAAALSVHLGGPAPIEDITFRNIRIEYDASEMESILQRDRDQKAVCKSPWSGRWLDISNGKMFAAGSMYTKSNGLDVVNEPYGTFKKVIVEDIDITVDDGAVHPSHSIQAQPGSTFGEIVIENVRINGEEFKR